MHALSFILLVVAVAVGVVPHASEAQQAENVPRIGLLLANSPSDSRTARQLQAFRQGLRERGYVEGQNIAIESRWAEGRYEQLPGLAADLVRLNVKLIVTSGTPAIQAAKHATQTIPIVMVAAIDPVATGFVASLARPGGNITGMSFMLPELVGKQLEMLKEVLPKVSRVALLGNPGNPGNAQQVRHAQDTARALNVQLQLLEARDPSGIDNAFAAITTERADAVIVLVDSMLLFHRTRIADHAARRRLPTLSGMIEDTEVGGLLAYGPSISDRFRRAATYVDRILKGAKPADLPVEQPTTFELVINLKTAKALGLTIPRSLLQRADHVIQ
jgi:putative tryptophan/tyrosine transport system substrate-binding protein